MISLNSMGPLALFVRAGICTGLLVTVSACSDQTQLPVGAQLQITPSSRIITVGDRSDADGNCFIDTGLYVDMPIVLSMTNADGSPMGDVDVSVYVDYSGNTFPLTPVMALYDDRRGNNNGVIDDFELVSGEGDDIVTVQTDSYGGDRPLLLRVNVSCPFKGDVFAFSGAVSASAIIEIVAQDGNGQTSL